MSKITVKIDKCKACYYCIEFCNKKLINVSKNINSKGYFFVEFEDTENKCKGCTLCAVMCPETAIEVFKEENE